MRVGLACDLCEDRADLAWVIRTDHFTVVIADEPHHYTDDEEWGLCAACKRDVLADNQAAIMARRRRAVVRDTGTSEWLALEQADRSAVFQIVDLIVCTVLATRQRAYGRAWTVTDERNAIQQVREDGGRGKRR